MQPYVCMGMDRNCSYVGVEFFQRYGSDCVLRERYCAFHRDRDSHPSECSGGEEGLGVCAEVHMVFMLMDAEPVKSHGNGVPSESSRNEHAVHVQTDSGFGHLSGVQLAVEGELCEVDHRKYCVLAVGIDYVWVFRQ